jgi:hypothetical protein
LAVVHVVTHSTPMRATLGAAWVVVVEEKTNSRTVRTDDARVNRLI